MVQSLGAAPLSPEATMYALPIHTIRSDAMWKFGSADVTPKAELRKMPTELDSECSTPSVTTADGYGYGYPPIFADHYSGSGANNTLCYANSNSFQVPQNSSENFVASQQQQQLTVPPLPTGTSTTAEPCQQCKMVYVLQPMTMYVPTVATSPQCNLTWQADGGTDFNELSEDDKLAIFLAAKDGQADVVAHLLKKRAAVNHSSNDSAQRFLHEQSGHTDSVATLLAPRADVAAKAGHTDAVPCVPAASRKVKSQMDARRKRGIRKRQDPVAEDYLWKGRYIAVKNKSCRRDACRIEPKQDMQSGFEPYHKCHCQVVDHDGQSIRIKYVNQECGTTEELFMGDYRIFKPHDEQWCAHGKVCNRMLRNVCDKDNAHRCRQYFCHDYECAKEFVFLKAMKR